ncbi:MAG: PTS sugar transporter subunit IIA [Spirochaetaceae bacterium]
MALIDKIREEVVKVPLEGRNKPEILRELVQVLVDAGELDDVETAYRALLEREGRGSTGLEKGIAVPHAKCDAVGELTLAIGIAPQGVDFDAQDGNPSFLFFLMLAAPDKSGPHIEALSEIARLTRSDAFCRALKNAESAKDVVELIRE